MSKAANPSFKIKSWDENPYQELHEQSKFTKASIVYSYSGDLEGESKAEMLMFYDESGFASYVGLEHVVGNLQGKSGSFVIEHRGTADAKGAKTTLSIIEGSGTGELKGIKGQGKFESGHAESYPMFLEYDFAEDE